MGIKDLIAKLLYHPIRIYNIFKIKRWYGKQNIDKIKVKEIELRGKTLVIAPHVDDETIGMGGILQSGCSFDLFYMTDSGDSRGKGTREEKSETRKKELDRILNACQLRLIDFLDEVKNGDLDWDINLIDSRIKKVLENGYDQIFTVCPIDAHDEHNRVTKILANSLEVSDFKGDIYLYEVSNLMPLNWINSYHPMSKEQFKNKMRFYNFFKSQKMMDFDIFQLLNRYKGCQSVKADLLNFFVN
ncbi:MAG: PIG-L family deacetylase [Tissierellia bacterium]|nr:PIG-L family deacetylase [Tissierellia bacterium]